MNNQINVTGYFNAYDALSGLYDSLQQIFDYVIRL